MTKNNDWSAERVADRLQIQDVMSRYGAAVDRIDLPALAAAFHPDAIIDIGSRQQSVAEFVAGVGKRHPGVPVGFHMTGNLIIDFIGPDQAFVEVYGLAFEQHPPIKGQGTPVDRLGRVRYGDQFERREGKWRIAKRMVVLDHVSIVPVDPNATDPIPAPAAGGAPRFMGLRNGNDPIAKARVALGVI